MNKSAEELFRELGYELIENNKYYLLYNKELKENAEFENDNFHIAFEKKNKTAIKTYGDDNTPEEITMPELNVINKQVEELGWKINE